MFRANVSLPHQPDCWVCSELREVCSNADDREQSGRHPNQCADDGGWIEVKGENYHRGGLESLLIGALVRSLDVDILEK